MNHPVSLALEQANQAQRLAQRQRNEAAMLETLKRRFGDPPVHEAPAQIVMLSAFVQWCEAKGVRPCPAQPAVIAQFILENASLGIDAASDAVEHIASMHETMGLANPVATWIVAEAMNQICDETKPPRTWPKKHWWRFTQLPCDLRRYLFQRDKEVQRTVSTALREAAEARNELAAIRAPVAQQEMERMNAETQAAS